MNALSVLIVVGVLGLNLWASVLLLRSRHYSAAQKAAQLAIIWALPLIGAIVVWFVMREPSGGSVNADPGETHLRQRGVTWGDYSDHPGGDDVGH
jgi:hypothetical protein